MHTKLNDIMKNEIDDIVATGEKLSRDAAHSDENLGPQRIEELSLIASRGGQFISRLYGQESHYYQSLLKVTSTPSFTIMNSRWYGHVSELEGIFKGVQNDINSGMISNFRQLIQAQIFADFLEMAEYLLSEGYKDAAAVLLGAVLEDSLRKLAISRGVSITSPNDKPLTIDSLNVALVKDETYNPLVQKQVTTWANLRNDAAHGHFDKYDADYVRQMLMFVQKFSQDYLQ